MLSLGDSLLQQNPIKRSVGSGLAIFIWVWGGHDLVEACGRDQPFERQVWAGGRDPTNDPWSLGGLSKGCFNRRKLCFPKIREIKNTYSSQGIQHTEYRLVELIRVNLQMFRKPLGTYHVHFCMPLSIY